MRGIATEVSGARAAVAVLAAAGLFGLAGCGSTGDQRATPTSPPASAEAATDAATDGPGDEGQAPTGSPVSAQVMSVVADPESTQLNVLTSACSDQPKVDIRETATQVWVAAEGQGSAAAPGCAKFAKADLQAPLGDRAVMNAHGGDPVDVFPLSQYDEVARANS